MHDFTSHLLLIYHQNEWLADIGLIFFGMLLFHWFSRVVYHFLLRKFDASRYVWTVSLIKSVHAPWLTFFWLMAFTFMLQIFMMRFHIDLSKLAVMNTIRSFLFILTWYWSLMSFITHVEFSIAPRWSYVMLQDKTTLRALAQLTRVILTIFAILVILPMLGFRTSSLVAFAGVSGIGLTIAAKDSFSNFMGGMMIFWDRPFSVGDWVRSPDRNLEGYVEHVGWRLTRIRTFAKTPLYVPNSVFSTVIIENPSRMANRFINVMIGVRYDDANLIATIVKDINEMIHHLPGIDTTQTIMVHFTEMAASSLNINVYAYTKTTESAKYRQILQELFLKSIAIITKHGAECAFPTTTVLMSSALQGAHNGDRREQS